MPSPSPPPATQSSDQLSLAVPDESRPPPVKHASAPAYQSPLRHHRRAASHTREVKVCIPSPCFRDMSSDGRDAQETLNARSEYSNSEDDGTAQHRINQYIVKQEIGRGSFGAVHLAVDQFGTEFAVKEFSKSRLRKRAQSSLLRNPGMRRRQNPALAGRGFNLPLHRHSSSDTNNSLDLIREEIAVMKKLNHPNLVSLIEVLDDPDEDSLYMVLELCKKGVVMRVGLEERADPYHEEQCRCWFRDMILGIEYLHAQGIIHRDIKPDNCLITNDDVLKIVDFGVSEMFEKDSEMKTKKSAGSPAFMPPELCVPKHGDVSGKAADIWSMGVTLYCLRFGRIPFEKAGMIDLYDSIRNDEVELGPDCDDDFADLMRRVLDKNPETRIVMDDLREHRWVTRRGMDRLLPKEENVATIIEPPTEDEVNAAITGNMGHLLIVMKAVKRFKQLLFRRRPDLVQGIFGQASRMVQPPLSMKAPHDRVARAQSEGTANSTRTESKLSPEGLREVLGTKLDQLTDQLAQRVEDSTISSRPSSRPSISPSPRGSPAQGHPVTQQVATRVDIGKGHAHDPLEDTLFLDIDFPAENLAQEYQHVVCESPSAVDMDVYEKAYEEEIKRIVKERGQKRPTLYLTRRVEGKRSICENPSLSDALQLGTEASRQGASTLAKLVEKAKNNTEAKVDEAAGSSKTS
ncbi:kinase-like domain-containing protein [Phyllosticta citricarpa]|uniref:Kinase-like domain-containing protein n=1 Tax=Phyllosticta citricarpa TaxID=55181 RepID=A0ABR1LDL7_9PEZI